MKVFQTHQDLDFVLRHDLHKKSYVSWKNSFEHHFYSDVMQDEFMRKHFPEFYDRYSSFPVPVMKAGLWRICVIYKYGGVYADMDSICQTDPEWFERFADLDMMAIGVENKAHLCDWCFVSPRPEHPVLRHILDECYEKIHAVEDYRDYGKHFVHVCTGPESFTHGVERYLKEKGEKLYLKGERDKYAGFQDENLSIYPIKTFREDKVKHLFTGGKPMGWLHDVKAHLGESLEYVSAETLEEVLKGQIVVTSHGGVGSTYVRKLLGLPDPHSILVDGKKYTEVHGDGGVVAHFPHPLKTGPQLMIYIYGDVLNAVCSQIKRFPLNAGRLNNQKGYAIRTIKDMAGRADPFNIEKQVRNYLNDTFEHDYPIVCLNYSKLDNSTFQELRKVGLVLPFPYERRERSSDWTQLPEEEQKILVDAYGDLNAELESLPPVLLLNPR